MQPQRRDGIHQAEAQHRGLRADEVLRLFARALNVTIGLLEERFYLLPELGEMRIGAFAMKQRAAQLVLQRLDGARERGLRDAAMLRRAREIQFLAQAEKIADLMQFHGVHLPTVKQTTPPCCLRNAECVST